MDFAVFSKIKGLCKGWMPAAIHDFRLVFAANAWIPVYQNRA